MPMSPKFPIPGLTTGFAPNLSRFLLCSLFFYFFLNKNSNYEIYICIQLTSVLGKHNILENIIKSTLICAIFIIDVVCLILCLSLVMLSHFGMTHHSPCFLSSRSLLLVVFAFGFIGTHTLIHTLLQHIC